MIPSKFPAAAILLTCCGFFLVTGQTPERPVVYTAAQLAAGKAAYEGSCIYCHTETLRGRTGAAGELPALESIPAGMREMVQNYQGKIPPLAGPDFLAAWGGGTTKELAGRIDVAVGGFPPKGAERDTYLWLTAYVLQTNGAQPGNVELTANTAVSVNAVTGNEPKQQKR